MVLAPSFGSCPTTVSKSGALDLMGKVVMGPGITDCLAQFLMSRSHVFSPCAAILVTTRIQQLRFGVRGQNIYGSHL
jgi:hypothetical protein